MFPQFFPIHVSLHRYCSPSCKCPLHFWIPFQNLSLPLFSDTCLVSTCSIYLFVSSNQYSQTFAGRTRRKAQIVYRVMWREMKRGFTDWATQVGEVLWMRERLWQLWDRRCRRVLRLCLIGADVHHIQRAFKRVP